MPYNPWVNISAFYIAPIGWAFILFLVFRLMSKTTSRRNRLIVPIAVVILISIIGASFTFILSKDIISFILNYPLPTLAIFTLLPAVETIADWRGEGKDIAAFSICYSILYFWYYWVLSMEGLDMIFLTIFSPMPTDNVFLNIVVVTLYNYTLLTIIVGLIIAGPFVLIYVYRSRRQIRMSE